MASNATKTTPEATQKPAASQASTAPESTADSSETEATTPVQSSTPATGTTSSASPSTSASQSTLSPLASGAASGASLQAVPSATSELPAASRKLFTAIDAGNLKDVKTALKDGADLRVTDDAGRTPLMRAVIVKNEQIAKTLLDAGSDPNVKDDYQESPFLRASANGSTNALQAFIKAGANVHQVNRMGGTALTVANSQVAAVRILLRTDINIDQVNDLGWTALHETIVLGQGTNTSVNIAQMLITNGADPRLKDRTGSDSFKLARERQQSQMLNMLQAASNR